MPRIEVRILGSFRVLVDGEERRISARKQRVLLATLATRPRTRSRERIVADLWPDSDEERGRQSLRHALYEVHAAVAHPLVVGMHDDLRLDDGVAVDAREFERAALGPRDEDRRRALELYTGDLCAELEGAEAEAERMRLRGLFAVASEVLAEAILREEPRAAEVIARRVIEIDPYREEAHRVLLRALAAAGDRAGAALHYRRVTSLLREELGVEPSVETKRVYAAIGQPLAPADRARVVRPPIDPPAELVGRREEYARVMTAVTDAIDGRGANVLLLGEPGVGKSRLVEEIANVAERHGVRVLRARAAAAEGALPFQVWVDALAPCAAEAAGLPAPWPAVLATLLPDAAHDALGAVAPELRRTRLFEGVARLLAQLAASVPTVVVLDDLHDADADSVQLYHYVARAARSRRLATIATSRPIRAGSPLAEARASLVSAARLVAVPLEPFAPDAVGELLRRFGVAAATVDAIGPRIASLTAGNPFFVLEVARALVEQGRLVRAGAEWSWSGAMPAPAEALAPELPATVRQTILGRAGELPEATRRVLDLTAVIGTPARLETIAGVAGRDELEVGLELAPAIDAGFLREARDAGAVSLRFAHELVRDAAYQHIPLSVRAAMHRRVAAALERSGGTSRAIAFHLSAGGEATRAAEHWVASAREAEARFAHDDAIASLQSALAALGDRSPRRAEILTAIGDAHTRRGSAAAALAAFGDALAALPADASDDRAALWVRIAAAARYYARDPRALEYAEAAVAHYRRSSARGPLADALVALAWVRYQEGDASAAGRAGEEARAIARELDDARIEARALHVLVWSRWLAGDTAASVDGADVERLSRELGEDEAIAVLLGIVAVAALRRGDANEAAAAARRALELSRRIGSLRAQLENAEHLANALKARGEWREALDIAEEVLADTERLALDAAPHLRGLVAVLLALLGEAERARVVADEILRASPIDVRPLHGGATLDAIAALLSAGELPDTDLVDRLRPVCATCQGTWFVVAGRHAGLGGDAARALDFAEEIATAPAHTRLPTSDGLREHLRALAFARLGRLDESERAAQAARAVFRAAARADEESVLERDLRALASVHA